MDYLEHLAATCKTIKLKWVCERSHLPQDTILMFVIVKAANGSSIKDGVHPGCEATSFSTTALFGELTFRTL
jgi:hypothetical protein